MQIQQVQQRNKQPQVAHFSEKLTRVIMKTLNATSTMAISSASALQLLDGLIEEVKALSTQAAVSGLLQTSFDLAWRPDLPMGHSPYSWLGEGGETDGIVVAAPAAAAAASAKEQKRDASANKKEKKESVPATVATVAATTATPVAGATGKDKSKKDKAAAPAKAAVAAPAVAVPVVASAPVDENQNVFSRLDIRVGKIVECTKVPKSNSLYMEKIDVGEAEPRQVLSGLANYVPIEKMIGASLLVICNLQPSKLMGHMSYGMVLAASDKEGKDKTTCELVLPPSGSRIGERVSLAGENLTTFTALPRDVSIDGRAEGSVWQRVAPGLRTDANGIATWNGTAIVTSGGSCIAPTIRTGYVS